MKYKDNENEDTRSNIDDYEELDDFGIPKSESDNDNTKDSEKFWLSLVSRKKSR